MTAVTHPPVTEHVDALPPEVKAANDKQAAHDEFAKDVQSAVEKRDAVLAKYPDTSLAGITAAAWEATKDDDDPSFNACILSHRQKLLTHAEAVQRLGVTGENPSDFERKVAELTEAAKPKAAAAKKK